MSLKADIVLAQQEAMKVGKKDKLSILRMVSSDIKNQEIKKQTELDDEAVQVVIGRQVKQLQDALQDFERGQRVDLVTKTKKEIELLSSYLPAQMSDEDLTNKATAIIGALGNKADFNIGQAMGAVMKEVKGQADGNRVKAVVTAIIQK
jgi:uncharacterized protein